MTVDWYRIGDGHLGIDSECVALGDRFRFIYGGCAVKDRGDGPAVVCRARAAASGRWLVEFDDPEPLDTESFVEAAFPGRTFPLAHGHPETDDAIGIVGDALVAGPAALWQPLVANLAVSRLQRLERDVVFFHAASMSVAGSGVLACGPKRSGKTTLSMAMASRGHELLGDEMAALRLPTAELVPCRRSLSVREGPAAAATQAARDAGVVERYPDGELRSIVEVRTISATADAARLTHIALLRTFGTHPHAERTEVSPQLLAHLTPLAASLWQRTRPQVVMQLLRALRSVRVFWLDAGTPDETAIFLEHLVEDTWP